MTVPFRMPAEWEPHEATWIAWPHHEPDWPGKLEPIPWVYGEIVRVLHTHERVEILERDEQGRPKRSRQVVKIVGISDEQILDYEVHDDGVSWTLVSASQQKAQDGRYTLIPDGDRTRVRPS